MKRDVMPEIGSEHLPLLSGILIRAAWHQASDRREEDGPGEASSTSASRRPGMEPPALSVWWGL